MTLACLKSWQRLNPSWTVQALTAETLPDYLPADVLTRATETSLSEIEALSDRIRIELLARYGGVWVDATTMCARPLDEWLDAYTASGFFAFESPGPDRAIASWFLAAEKGNHIVDEWRHRTAAYWFGRKTRGDDYFWFHRLFAEAHASDPEFWRAWEATPRLPAMHLFHFGPTDERLMGSVEQKYVDGLNNSPPPVFKLSHKQVRPIEAGSVADLLCRFGVGELPFSPIPVGETAPKKRVLVAWYGAFRGHGTVGDLRSLESVVAHLVARGHNVMHATADDVHIPGAVRVDWEQVSFDEIDCSVFVCGPILSFHPLTNALFKRLSVKPIMGAGVSLLPRDDPHHANPFDAVLARQGASRDFGDVAIVAPPGEDRPVTNTTTNIGVALRGEQSDYGEGRCKWRETEALAMAGVQQALSVAGGVVTNIENHLERSNLTPDAIEALYADCDVVITSRYHGAVCALRQGVPFIAIDQIEGGAKVYDLLAPLGWKHVYRVDELDAATVRSAVTEILTMPDLDQLFEARSEAVRAANETLTALDQWLR
jgi:hypothetical protein